MTFPPDVVAWCGGLPCSGERPLNAEDRALLRKKLVRALVQRLVPVWGGVPLLLVPVLLEIVLQHAPREKYELAAGTVGVLAWFLGLPVVLLLWRDAFRRVRRYRRDLADGVVLVFGAEARRLEVLPASGLVVAGAVPKRRAHEPISVAVRPPESPNWFPVRASELPATMPGPVRWRGLTSGEKAEIALHLPRFTRPSLANLGCLVYCALGGLGYVAMLSKGEDPGTASMIQAAVTSATAVILGLSLWRNRRVGRLLARDLEAGKLYTDGRHEFLPISGILFSAGGVPDRWRLRPIAQLVAGSGRPDARGPT